jgi:hypothetical protein
MCAHKLGGRNSDSHTRSPHGVTAISASEFSASLPFPDPLSTAKILQLPHAANGNSGAADGTACAMLSPEDFLLDRADLDPESCPPDRCYVLSSEREAWVYDHGDVADLIFVRCG